MPLYRYECEFCLEAIEVVQHFHEDPLEACTGCGRPCLQRVLFPPTIMDATPKTMGSLAEKNSSANTYELQERRRGGEEAREAVRPWYRDGPANRNLAALSPEQKLNYVATGDPAKRPDNATARLLPSFADRTSHEPA